MRDDIIFYNWPDMEKYKQGHPYDKMTTIEIYGEYLRLKNENPMVSDEELSQRVGKSAYYFQSIKDKIRRESCEKRLLRSV